jgi:hypothetical protein
VVYETQQTFTNYKPQPNLPHRKRVDPKSLAIIRTTAWDYANRSIISILTRPWPSSPITWPLATTPIAPGTLITASSGSFTWRAEGKLNVIHRNGQTFVTAQKKGADWASRAAAESGKITTTRITTRYHAQRCFTQ